MLSHLRLCSVGVYLRAERLWSRPETRIIVCALFILLLLPTMAHAQGTGSSPWEKMAKSLENAFTGTIARSLSAVGIVIGGLMWIFGEGHQSRISSIVFGVAMAMGAAQFLLFITGS